MTDDWRRLVLAINPDSDDFGAVETAARFAFAGLTHRDVLRFQVWFVDQAFDLLAAEPEMASYLEYYLAVRHALERMPPDKFSLDELQAIPKPVGFPIDSAATAVQHIERSIQIVSSELNLVLALHTTRCVRNTLWALTHAQYVALHPAGFPNGSRGYYEWEGKRPVFASGWKLACLRLLIMEPAPNWRSAGQH